MSEEPPPLLNNRFTVSIEGSNPDSMRRDLGFSRISGLSSSAHTSVRLPLMRRLLGYLCRTCETNQIVLQRALDTDHYFFDWHRANLRRTVDLRTLTIFQLDRQTGKPVNCWRLHDCWIITWHGPDFNAMNSDISYETITLCYRSVSWLKSPGIS
ncbi:MAG: phage tail protein [Candidatus Thiodiazotropha sp.]